MPTVLLLATILLVGHASQLRTPPNQNDKKPEASQTLSEQIAAIKLEHENLDKKFYDDLRAASREMTKVSQLNNEHSAAVRQLADRLRALIRQHRDEPEVFEGILVLVGTIRHPLADDLVRLVLDKYGAHPKMGQLCFDLTQRSREDWAERIIKSAADKHPLPDVRGQAIYALAEYNRWRGLPLAGNTQPTPMDAERSLAEAERLFKEVVNAHADVRSPDGMARLGDKAAIELARLHNLPNLAIGKTAPTIDGEDVDGKPMKLSDYRGKVVVLDFWGHW